MLFPAEHQQSTIQKELSIHRTQFQVHLEIILSSLGEEGALKPELIMMHDKA